MAAIVRKFTKFNDAEFTAEHVTIYDDGTVKTTSQSRFEYEKQIQNSWHPQKDWKKSLYVVRNTQRSNILQFQPRTK